MPTSFDYEDTYAVDYNVTYALKSNGVTASLPLSALRPSMMVDYKAAYAMEPDEKTASWKCEPPPPPKPKAMPVIPSTSNPARNERCPCGSGRKFKLCCMGGRRQRITQPAQPVALSAPNRRQLVQQAAYVTLMQMVNGNR